MTDDATAAAAEGVAVAAPQVAAASPERVLIITGVFSSDGENPWLLDDLAQELAGRGMTVDVLVNDTRGGRPRGWRPGRHPGIRVLSVGKRRPRGRAGKTLAYLTGIVRMHRAWTSELRHRHYDLVLYHTIATFTGGLPLRVSRSGSVGTLACVVWDFFPLHHVQIGRIRQPWLSPLLRAMEGASIAAADLVAVMSPHNRRFLAAYHPGVHCRVVEVPPWGCPEALPADRPKRGRFTVVFGGQLVAGRGVETLLRACRLLEDDGVDVEALVVGDGADRARLEGMASELGLTGTTFLGHLPRAAYLDTIGTAHAGVAGTVSGASVPTFPSKIVDYARAGLPIVVALESASDAGQFVTARGCGLSVPAGDERALADAIRVLADEHAAGTLDARSQASRRFFTECLSASVAADRLLSSARETRR